VANLYRNISLEQRISSIRNGDVTHLGTPGRSRRLTVQPRKKTDVPDDIVNWLRKKQRELEEFWWPNEDPPLTQYGKAADEIKRLRAAGDSMAKLLTRLPCSCVEGSNGEINETCEMCERFFHWEEARRG
jgi:hypothetical protein